MMCVCVCVRLRAASSSIRCLMGWSDVAFSISYHTIGVSKWVLQKNTSHNLTRKVVNTCEQIKSSYRYGGYERPCCRLTNMPGKVWGAARLTWGEGYSEATTNQRSKHVNWMCSPWNNITVSNICSLNKYWSNIRPTECVWANCNHLSAMQIT